MSDSIFIISYYKSRNKQNLYNLLKQLKIFKSKIAVIINDDETNVLKFEEVDNVYTLFRKNIGMNIGAWNEGYRYFSDYENYFFFQDECFIKKNIFFEKYLNLLSKKDLGLIGETVNTKWSKSWDEMQLSPMNYKILVNEEEMLRVNFYKKQITEWGIELGYSPIHLRSLSMAIKSVNLKKINGFNIGFNKEECIASEIAISKKIMNLNLKIAQSNKEHFYYIGHKEWHNDGKRKLR